MPARAAIAIDAALFGGLVLLAMSNPYSPESSPRGRDEMSSNRGAESERVHARGMASLRSGIVTAADLTPLGHSMPFSWQCHTFQYFNMMLWYSYSWRR